MIISICLKQFQTFALSEDVNSQEIPMFLLSENVDFEAIPRLSLFESADFEAIPMFSSVDCLHDNPSRWLGSVQKSCRWLGQKSQDVVLNELLMT